MKNNIPINDKKVNDTAVVFALACLVAGIISGNITWLYIASGIMAILLIFPIAFKPIAFIWFKVAHLLSWLITRIILSILFFFLVTPVAIIRRLAGKDSLKLKFFKKSTSGFVTRNHLYQAEDLKYPF